MHITQNIDADIARWLAQATAVRDTDAHLLALDRLVQDTAARRKALVSNQNILRGGTCANERTHSERAELKAVHHQLAVIVPAHRLARALRQQVSAATAQPAAQALAAFLLSRVLRTTPAELLGGRVKRWRDRLPSQHTPQRQVKTAQILIDRHPELFPALPAHFRACAPRLDEQVTEAQRQALDAAKKALLQKIRFQVILSTKEAALLQRFLG